MVLDAKRRGSADTTINGLRPTNVPDHTVKVSGRLPTGKHSPVLSTQAAIGFTKAAAWSHPTTASMCPRGRNWMGHAIPNAWATKPWCGKPACRTTDERAWRSTHISSATYPAAIGNSRTLTASVLVGTMTV